MSDLTKTISNSNKWLLLVKYMTIILCWLLILIVSPDSIKEFVLEKTELPYSYQFLTLAISVVFYPVFLLLGEKIKKSRLKKKIKKTLERLDEDELDVLFHFIDKKINTLNLDVNEKSVRGLVTKGILFNAGANPIGSLYICTFVINDVYVGALEDLYYE